MTKPIDVWLFPEGPNPMKIIFALEEIGVPYEIKQIKSEDVRREPLIKLNPNGRVPVIEDPNTGLVLWESVAILMYLAEKYDKDNALTYTTGNEKHLVNQWLLFQASGQGPYFGQASWFMRLHPEKLPSAIERYQNEMKRVTSVLEGHLQGREWLVGDKITIADLAWTPYTLVSEILLGRPDHPFLSDYPNVAAWFRKISTRPSWVKVMEIRSSLMDPSSK
ncbi:glutathione transferase [Daldinia bambusicola]|nr:glutathione transferase [Daldinia bambusicola]